MLDRVLPANKAEAAPVQVPGIAGAGSLAERAAAGAGAGLVSSGQQLAQVIGLVLAMLALRVIGGNAPDAGESALVVAMARIVVLGAVAFVRGLRD